MTKGIFIPFNASRAHDAEVKQFAEDVAGLVITFRDLWPELNIGTPHIRLVED